MITRSSFVFMLASLALLPLAVATASPVAAQSVSKESLVKALRGNTFTTRGANLGKPSLSSDQKALINSLATRGTRAISVEERKTITKIAKETKSPSIDLEILFDYNSSAIRPASMPNIIKLGQALSDDSLKGGTFIVAGHTDARGSAAYNLKLSQARSLSVKNFLVSNFGIKSDKLLAVGHGEEQPKIPGNPEAAANRRVQIINLAQ